LAWFGFDFDLDYLEFWIRFAFGFSWLLTSLCFWSRMVLASLGLAKQALAFGLAWLWFALSFGLAWLYT